MFVTTIMQHYNVSNGHNSHFPRSLRSKNSLALFWAPGRQAQRELHLCGRPVAVPRHQEDEGGEGEAGRRLPKASSDQWGGSRG